MTLIGWCPGGRPVDDMLKLYPFTGAARLFYGFRDPVPTAWGGPDLDPLGGDVLPMLSFKVWDLPAMLALAGAIPPGAVVGLSYHHEDEQQDGGDIPPELFVARWVELARAFEGHPKRDQVILAPIFTRVWWEKHPGDLRYWPGEVAHLLDAVGWDVYNNGSSYRTPDDLLRIPREMAARTGLPYFVGELGAVRLAGDDGGVGRSAWMRAMVDAARNDGALAVCWFHKDEWDLTGPASAGEQQTLRELIQEASVDWHLAPSLKVLRDEINARWPNRDKTSDGSIGDAAHQAGTSDHNPNIRGSVDAIDIDKDGVDIPAIIAAVQAHPSAHYWIFEREIADRDDNWRRRPYDGPNPHDHHMHVSIRQTVTAEQNTQPWGLLEDVVTPEDIEKVAGRTKQLVLSDGGMQQLFTRVYQLGVNVQKLLTAAGEDPVDEAAVAGEVLRVLTPAAIAAALPPEVARQVADEIAGRLAS